jgi:hypothetical protein
VSIERVGSLDASLTINGGSLRLGLVFLIGTCVEKRKMLPTPLREAHGTSRPHEKHQQKRPTWVRVKCILTSLWAFLSRSLKPGSSIQGHHVSSNPRRAPVYFRLHHPTRGVSSGGTTCSLCLALCAIMIHRIILQFYVYFLYIFILMWSDTFSLSHFLSELCNHVTDVPAWGTCVLPGLLGYFSAWGPVLLNGCPWKS